LFSNIGTWIHEVAAGWLMTELSPSRFMVALVQAATMGPVFLLGLPAGALADIVDRRRLLIFAQIWNLVTAGQLATLAFAGLVTPGLLLSLVALMAIGSALHMPAFQAIVPELVPRAMLRPAVTLNGVSINLARAIGPALAGVIISVVGIWAAFAVNAVTFLAVLVIVWRWRPAPRSSRLPPEYLVRAVLVGLRYARHDRPLQIVLARAGLFMTCAAAGWALLPVVIRSELDRSATERQSGASPVLSTWE
jgi:MFS family permease